MSTVSRTFSVGVPPEIVVPYLADFAHAEQWDPGTVRCVRNDDGPVIVGSSWHNTSKIVGISTELTYTLEQLTDDTDRPRRAQRHRDLDRDDRCRRQRDGIAHHLRQRGAIQRRRQARRAARKARLREARQRHRAAARPDAQRAPRLTACRAI